eukprot:6661237-Prymnesium_polylepis.1
MHRVPRRQRGERRRRDRLLPHEQRVRHHLDVRVVHARPVGHALLRKLAKLLVQAADARLLGHVPIQHLDRRQHVALADAPVGQLLLVAREVASLALRLPHQDLHHLERPKDLLGVLVVEQSALLLLHLLEQ